MSNRITPDDLPWDELKKWGITRERMEKTGNLDRLLYGNYSKPVPFLRNDGGQKIEGEAAIRCYKSGDTWKIDMQTRCEKPTMKDWIGVYGVALNEEQKKQLLNTGHAGSPFVFKDKDGKENSVFVSLNHERLDRSLWHLIKRGTEETVTGHRPRRQSTCFQRQGRQRELRIRKPQSRNQSTRYIPYPVRYTP